ncbi:4-carboxymuconolactone decarboxylase /3-oxoadipate enol-lactonase [Jatrophihabitans endophyticus]|uniref:4-carboxymuconolactone decarboxylase /3-oxoadipate enol-lactonase n=1 Tax=Jatrophihabitans endophyticus TaxID=1206085 RepID=A0A1M5EDP2_9ACTN|nr:4-carboxymuconolactone decarboxylase [Jatrophihabitans endophyticus]SHF77307.1 4-carboxymuconolactone decarboxylase /3-oxoadipate enol-lactonase [Jatrophihabitans endophyticus]
MAFRLAVHEDGPPSAPPLVLLNSIGSTSEMWTPCLAPLVERFHVVRIDTRGHGESPRADAGPCTVADLAADVLATLDDLGLHRVALAGLSLGGMIGMHIAAHDPERISRLALLCTSARVAGTALWHDRAAAVRRDGMTAISEAVVARWITPALAERDPALVRRLRAMVESVDAESYAQCAEAIAQLDETADLARIAAPTLVIGAADDPALPPPHQRLLVDAIAGSLLLVLDDAAHVPTFEQSGTVASLLIDHFGDAAVAADGMATRRAVLGDAHVDAAVEATTPLTAPFQQFITRYAWGEVWGRPDLTRRERSVATLAALTAIGAEHELVLHVRAARRNGLTPEEIVGVLHHTAVYAGVPRANRAIAVARDVLAEEEQ